MQNATATTPSSDALVPALEAQLKLVTNERDRLRAAYDRLLQELTLLRRRLFVAKAERVDTAQLELDFMKTLAELDALGPTPEPAAVAPPPKPTRKPTGRRDVRALDLPEERVEVTDPLFEELVANGEATRIGFEESCKLGWQRGGMRRVVVARVKYQAVDRQGDSTVETAEVPPELISRCLAAPSLLAHILVDKYCDGLPLHRIEDRFSRDGIPLDRGTMCRWVEELGATFGATLVHAMKKDAMETAFCLATDATGIAIQPVKDDKAPRRPCKKGHFFVLIADRDHIFFEYLERETSAAVYTMLKGFEGYVQADAKSVYDEFFNSRTGPEDGGSGEVGCWSHSRRKFWEAATAKDEMGRQGLFRIRRLFELDASWQDRPPIERRRLRLERMGPELDAFFVWAEAEYEKVREIRGFLRSALGYAVRQKTALRRFLDDGRLKMDNNNSERQLRRIAVGRNAWLFCGSDDHATAAGHVFSLIASARLHRLDPEAYLREIIRVLSHWPKNRYLELSPKYWPATRARLDPLQLAAELGPLLVPEAAEAAP